jgi:DNA-binding beta-propeller fold protein YncE
MTTLPARVRALALPALLVVLASCAREQQAAEAPTAANGVPVFEVDPAWPKLPPSWRLASAIGLMVDRQGHIWVSHRAELLTDSMLALAAEQPGVPAPLVMELDPDGNVVQSWGDPAHVADYPPVLHSLFEDQNGFIWSNARDQQQIIKFTRDGKRVLTIGKLNETRGSADTSTLGRPADLEVDPETNELFVVDGYTNRRMIVFDAETGAYKRHWGAYGEPPDDAYRKDSTATTPSRQFDLVHNLVLSKDGLVYAADQNNSRVQVFDRSGKFITEKIVRPGDGAATALAISHEPGQPFLYVGDGSQDKVWILRRSDLEVIGEFGSRGSAPGQFGRPHNMDVDAQGNLFVTEAAPGMRVQKFVHRGYAPLAATAP